MSKTSVISTDIIDQYQKDGYVTIPNVIDPNLVEEAGQHIDWLQKKLKILFGFD